jgi:hypothetical protein
MTQLPSDATHDNSRSARERPTAGRAAGQTVRRTAAAGIVVAHPAAARGAPKFSAYRGATPADPIAPVPTADSTADAVSYLAKSIVVAPPASSAAVASAATLSFDSSAIALAVPQALAEYNAAIGGTLDGTGLSIGILSDSFNLNGGMAADIADGYLPSAGNIDIVSEGLSGEDEGRAMAELIYQIAPGAKIYFYSATNSESDFANGIDTLVNTYHVNVIVDDVTYFDEPFYQDTGVVTQAVENAVSAGVDYFTAANNSSDNFYESVFTPMTYTLPGIGRVTVHDVTGGSPYEKVALGTNPALDFTLEWTQPYGANAYDIGVGLYKSTGHGYALVENFATSTVGGDPVLMVQTSLTLAAGTYYLAFYDSAGTIPADSTFKLLFFQDSDATLTGVGAGVGSGASIGHELVPGANTVAAVNVANTPSQGVVTPLAEPFSASGSGVTYIAADGTTLATPIDDGKPDFAATDGSETTVFSPFDGTSAAAPNAAAVSLLMLQADSRLTTQQVTYLLERSAIATGNTVTGGAGLIQANTAVAGAITAASTPIWTQQDDSRSWSDGLNWSDGATPGAATPVQITDGLGLFSSAYTVGYDQRSDLVASLTVDGGSVTGAVPTLYLLSGDALTAGSVTLGRGTINADGSLVDTGALTEGSVAGTILVQDGGSVWIGGSAADGGIAYNGVGGQVVLAADDAETLITGLKVAISNFAVGDELDLRGLDVSRVAGVNVDGASATVVDAAGLTLAALTISGSFTNLGFKADRDGGTELLACFASGTRIATDCDEVPVEHLQPGQLLRTADGGLMPMRWLGRSRIAWRGLDPLSVLPIRIRAGALGRGLPRRDLLVSPGHALWLDGLLVQAGALVNGAGIVREVAMPPVFTYWHVELDMHALLLAEGAATESFVDGVEPIGFDNRHERTAPPDANEMPYPRCKAARQVPAALRARLAAWRPMLLAA